MTTSFIEHAGTWVGTNAFRLMPREPAHHAETTATVSTAAGAMLTVIAYTWAHHEDGAQDGLLVIGPGGEANRVTALWGDSWHQSEQPALLTGTITQDVLTLGYEYGGGWRWQIRVDAGDPTALALSMDNVVPASAATDSLPEGAYSAMTATLQRTS